MKKDIKNANGRIIGYIDEERDKISIHNGGKPILSITDKNMFGVFGRKTYPLL